MNLCVCLSKISSFEVYIVLISPLALHIYACRIVGLDLEYTPDGKGQTIVVMQLAMRKHVLVYHFCRCKDMH